MGEVPCQHKGSCTKWDNFLPLYGVCFFVKENVKINWDVQEILQIKEKCFKQLFISILQVQ